MVHILDSSMVDVFHQDKQKKIELFIVRIQRRTQYGGKEGIHMHVKAYLFFCLASTSRLL